MVWKRRRETLDTPANGFVVIPVVRTDGARVDIEKYDFYIPLPPEVKENTKHNDPLPASFLQIKEGDVDKGIDWYRKHYPKIPDELIEIMARYNFGDLNPPYVFQNFSVIMT